MAINATEFVEALDAIEASKGISRETTLTALKEAMIRGYRKQLGGDDADVRVNIDPEKGILEMFNVKAIVEDVQDDFLEISLEDAKEEAKANKGEIRDNEFFIPASVDDLRKATAMSIKAILKQKFAEVEKENLLVAFKDKINTMITGKVEKVDERGASVNIGRTSVFLPKTQMIGDERFNVGDPIRLFVSDVASGTKGAHIVVSRSNEGFLKCLFVEQIREIYDGTIIIKGISREGGERSKVAVYSPNPDVDPAGACIGPNGARIQKIVAELGNGNAKEKIDIIAWSENAGLFIMESLKPARVSGIIFDEQTKKATAIVKDDSLSLAIGRRGVNARLAVKLTGYNIDIKTESDALAEGLKYSTFEELQAQAVEAKEKAIMEARLAALSAQKETAKTNVLPGLPEGYVAPQERVYEEETNEEVEEALSIESENEEVSAPVSAPVEETRVSPKEENVEVKQVKTTTTLSDLEASLESSKEKKSGTKKNWKKNNKKDEEVEEEEKPVTQQADPKTYMSIYTEEELREMEEEDNKDDSYESEEEVDYDEYDEYYDDDNK